MKKTYIYLVFLAVAACNCNNSSSPKETEPTETIAAPAAITYSIVNTFPHDTSSYTQGLIWHNNTLYEGTGREGGFSKIAKVDLATGKALQQQYNDPKEFGEGIAILNNKLFQLTWQNHKVHVYDMNTFKKIGEFNWDKEGWGLTTDGKSLILSDGSNIIYFINPDTFQVEKTISVTDNYGMVDSINELEFVNGSIYANKYMTNYILKINAATGKVEGRLDLRDIFQQSGKTNEINKIPDPQEDVLNGIAYDSAKQSFYITGKQWPVLFEVKLK